MLRISLGGIHTNLWQRDALSKLQRIKQKPNEERRQREGHIKGLVGRAACCMHESMYLFMHKCGRWP